MRYFIRVAFAIAIGAAAMAAPILLSVYLAQRQSVADEESRVLSYALDALRRSDETGRQIIDGTKKLAASGYLPCSPEEMDLMRQIDLASSYIQAVGRISGDSLICTSLGTTAPIPVGPPTLITDHGAIERFDVHLTIAGGHPLAVISDSNFAFLIDPSLPVDTPTEGPDISIAIFVPSAPRHLAVARPSPDLRSSWYRDIPKGGRLTFVDSGYVVAVARSKSHDIAVVAAAPWTYIRKRVHTFTAVFVPIGIMCGLALAWAVAFISRNLLSLPALIRSAARRREFFVEYQPVVDLATGRWTGAEALVRWRQRRKVVPPDAFIPVAEESGVITSITRCVAEIVAEDLARLIRIDRDFCVAINLSATDLRSDATLGLLERTLRSAAARPHNLMIEATERGFLQGRKTEDLLQEIRHSGIGVAIDDFGTGYSSLSYLGKLKLDALKIDKSFVETVGTDGVTSQVVPHIIEMARSLRLQMIAEGVETEAQADFLRHRGVAYVQGWLYAKPMPIDALLAGLARFAPEESTV